MGSSLELALRTDFELVAFVVLTASLGVKSLVARVAVRRVAEQALHRGDKFATKATQRGHVVLRRRQHDLVRHILRTTHMPR